MCGIAGFNREDETRIRHLTRLLRHRGPEQEGYFTGGGVSLGHRRLPVIDLAETARQPMFNEDTTVAVVCNGEIFNFQSLREELRQAGHRFATGSDSEVLVHGYEEWGTGLPARLEGQFAFCLLERPAGRLLLARDRLGIKPLYYCAAGGDFIFGSELKVLLRSGIPWQLNPAALDHYLLFGFTTAEQPVLAGARQVLPGEYLVYGLAERRILHQARYWNLPDLTDESITLPAAAEETGRLLAGAVRSQLVADVPVGVFLSGGLDSPALVALARPHVRELETFNVGFDRPGSDESAAAREVAALFGTVHHEIRFGARNVPALAEELPDYFDEPFADPSMMPVLLVSRLARRHVTVVLSGTGADELFAGYPRYSEIRLLKRLNALPAPVKTLLRRLAGPLGKLTGDDRFGKLPAFLGVREDSGRLYPRLLSYLYRTPGEPVPGLTGFSCLPDCTGGSSPAFSRPAGKGPGGGDPAAGAMRFDLLHYLPECLLVKEDRACMAAGLENRVPFLDRSLVEFAAALPARLKTGGRRPKRILRQALRGVLPAEMLARRKQGFGVPLADYFRHELRDWAREEIRREASRPLCPQSFLARAWNLHQSGRADYSRLFWSVIMWSRWHRRWME